jgi:post-segregation antitoxin (ccd killing protein)
MNRKTRRAPASPAKRRTTVTIPADSLAHAKRIASARHSNLSAVISEALSEGLRRHAEAERSQQVFMLYKRAFGTFSDDELLLLDGVILDPTRGR